MTEHHDSNGTVERMNTAQDPAPHLAGEAAKAAGENLADPAPERAASIPLPTPAVGRAVLFYPALTREHGTVSLRDAKRGQPFPATITHVWGGQTVNLSVTPDGSFGDIGTVTSLVLRAPLAEGEEMPPGDFATWPLIPPNPLVAELDATRMRLRALTGKVGVLNAQVLGMLADYYQARREGVIGPIPAAEKAAAVAGVIAQLEGETDEQFADRKAKARRGIVPQA